MLLPINMQPVYERVRYAKNNAKKFRWESPLAIFVHVIRLLNKSYYHIRVCIYVFQDS